MGDDYQGYQKAMYAGGIIQGYMQIREEEKARKMAGDAKAIQENAVREETGRILEKEEVTQEEINAVFDDYGKEDKYKEYLVDGAILTCNELYDKDIDNINTIKILPLVPTSDESSDEFDNRIYTTLDVSENPISDNGSIYATVDKNLAVISEGIMMTSILFCKHGGRSVCVRHNWPSDRT